MDQVMGWLTAVYFATVGLTFATIVALLVTSVVLGTVSLRYVVRHWSTRKRGVPQDIPTWLCVMIFVFDALFLVVCPLTILSLVAAIATWIYATFIDKPAPASEQAVASTPPPDRPSL